MATPVSPVVPEQAPARASAELALAALQALSTLWLEEEVADECLPQRRRLDPLIRVVRKRGGREQREQAHLLLMHACVLRCAAAQDTGVRATAVDVLGRVGGMLGLDQSE